MNVNKNQDLSKLEKKEVISCIVEYLVSKTPFVELIDY